jgi:hypothetical protein
MLLFFALCSVGVAIAAVSAFVIFWPLSLVHLRDRHPALRERLGEGAFLNPKVLWWLLNGGYREAGDHRFSGLATPARVSLMTLIASLVSAALLWLWSVALS